MTDSGGETRYNMINHNLLRVRRTGTPFSKNINGTDVIPSLDQLRTTLWTSAPEIVSLHMDAELEADEMSEDEEEEENTAKQIREILDAARLLSPEEERKVLVEEIFDRDRQFTYESINEDRKAAGRPPWYILTREEVELVGFVLPYSLITHPNHKFIKETIKREGQRINDLKATGITVTPWSAWKRHRQNGRDISASISEKLIDI